MAKIVDGQQFGRFQIVSRLGRGGMASVYRAYEPSLDRTIALKVLPEELLDQPGFVERFEREARVVARLEHPHIVPLYASGIDEGQPWMALRLVRGGHLGDRMEGGAPALDAGLDLLAKIADALDFAHAQGIVHRDLKPQNILLGERGECYIADFGIASLLEGATKLTQTGAALGTPQYMAPEQAKGETVGPAADIYALGIIVYQWQTGLLPFDADTPYAVMYKHVSAPIPLEPLASLPERARQVICRALAKDPSDRWPSATTFVNELRAGLAVPSGVKTETSTPSTTWSKHGGSRTGIVGAAASAASEKGQASTQGKVPGNATRPVTDPKDPSRSGNRGRTAILVSVLTVLILAGGGWGAMTWLGHRDRASLDDGLASEVPADDVSRQVKQGVVKGGDRESTKGTNEPAAVATVAVDNRPPGERFRDCVACPEMVVIPSGRFEQGSPRDEPGRTENEGPVRTVQIAQFAMGRTEVTRGEFRRFVEATGYRTEAERDVDVPDALDEVHVGPNPGCHLGEWREGTSWRDPGFVQDDSHPAVCVSFNDGSAYVAWLAKETGKPYRLPSESEVEYANRAGTTTPWPWGGMVRQAVGWRTMRMRLARESLATWQLPAAPMATCLPHRWAHSALMRLACMIWPATCGSGRRTAGMTATAARLVMAGRGIAGIAPSVRCVAARGLVLRRTCVRPSDSGSRAPPAATSLGSASPGTSTVCSVRLGSTPTVQWPLRL